MAVEAGIAERDAREGDLRCFCYALILESRFCTARMSELEILGARLGLSDDSIRVTLTDHRRRASLLAGAHQFLKALIPVQDEVMALLEERRHARARAPELPAPPAWLRRGKAA